MALKEEKPNHAGNGPMPVDTPNLLSQITFWYSLPLIKIAKNRTLVESDLWDVIEVRGREGRARMRRKRNMLTKFDYWLAGKR
jgi:hypothetical protein